MIALAANGASVDIARVLTDLLILLVTARLAGELAERIRVPAVLGEIVAGVVIGPSVLGWVIDSSVLTVLGEIGVILLLLDVGLETDLRELGMVGKASIAVAFVGVAAPMAGGIVTMLAFGESLNIAVFVGAALTATSVGITARVFGDLGAVGSVAARTVLGAAVADDVLGLVLLTVVVKMLTTGSISVASVAVTVLLAVGYLVVASGLGMFLVPRFVRAMSGRARGAGTPVVMAFAITLAFSRAADLAHLAPIIGAFVAGLCLARTHDASATRHQLASVGHLFIPVFFLRIGIETNMAELLRRDVLALAGALTVVAVAGKLISGLAAGRRTDRLLVGLGMIPRGEVGLIFAGIGLSTGLLTGRLYAAILLVVLVSTVVTPPLLRWRIGSSPTPDDEAAEVLGASVDVTPAGGWFGYSDETIELVAIPNAALAADVAFAAAAGTTRLRPGPQLVQWLSSTGPAPDELSPTAFVGLGVLVRVGGFRGWRLLDATGFLRRFVPELAGLADERRRDRLDLDATDGFRFDTAAKLNNAEPALLLAALATDGPDDLVALLGRRFGLDQSTIAEAEWLVANADRLTDGARRLDGMNERELLELAVDAGSIDRAGNLAKLAAARPAEPQWIAARRDELARRLVDAYNLPEVGDVQARDIIAARRVEVVDRLDGAAAAVVARAPRSWLMAQPVERLVIQARLAARAMGSRRPQVEVGRSNGFVIVDLAANDGAGLLARSAAVLSEAGADIVSGEVSVWDEVGVSSFVVAWSHPLTSDQIAANLADALDRAARPAGTLTGLDLTWPSPRSPWTTPLQVRGDDRPHALADVCAALSASGATVQSARVGNAGVGRLDDSFELTDAYGRPLDIAGRHSVEAALLGRRPRRAHKLYTRSKHSGNRAETAHI